MKSIKSILLQSFLPIFILINFAQIQGQTPELPGWHSDPPLQMSMQNCYETARHALNSEDLVDQPSVDHWFVHGINYNVRARILCVPCGEGVLVSIVVAATHNYSEATSIRDNLRDYFLWVDNNTSHNNPQNEGSSGIRESYTTTFGMLRLKQNGNIITGTYESGQGTLQGTLSGNVLQGTWSNSASDKQGTFRFVFDGDFSNFNGTWGYNNEPKTRNWSGH